jgi:hypothetical protein
MFGSYNEYQTYVRVIWIENANNEYVGISQTSDMKNYWLYELTVHKTNISDMFKKSVTWSSYNEYSNNLRLLGIRILYKGLVDKIGF